jgi:hypothetical protein
MSATIPKEWLSRKEAAAYLASKGLPISAGHLSNLASNNNAKKGPPFTRLGWRTIRYKREDLDTWYSKRAQKVE